jgi:heme-degrading monooxygenase HmoA
VWEFQVPKGMEKRFEQVYGAKGSWARFFAQDEAYMGTELIHHLKRGESKAGRTYITLDFWASQNAYDAFRRQHFARYEAIDQKCQEMTESEREIGSFVRVLNK